MITIFFQLVLLFILLGVIYIIYRSQPQELKQFFLPALVFKVAAGLALGYLYFYHYGFGDTIAYWKDGKIIAEKVLSNPIAALQFLWEDNPSPEDLAGLINDKPRSLFFVKITGLLALLSGGNYVLMSILISCVSFMAAWYVFRKLIELLPAAKIEASVSFLYFPSIVFWSSGLIKESLGLASLFFIGGFFLMFYGQRKANAWEWLAVILFFWIGWNLKYYWMGIFIPVLMATAIVMQLCRWRPDFRRMELFLWAGLFSCLLLAASVLHPNFYPSRIMEVIWENNQEFMLITKPGNAIHFNDLQPELARMAVNAPGALLAGIFRPFIWESQHWLSALAAIENSIVLLLVVFAVTTIRQWITSPHRMLAMAVAVYSILMAIFLALSTPNLGTLSRYKIGFLPFLFFLILYRNPVFGWIARRLPLGHHPDPDNYRYRDKT